MIETKVTAATAASAVAGLVLWVLGRYVFHGGAVPDVVQSWIYTLAPAAVTFAAGYYAKHTPRAAPVVVALPQPQPPVTPTPGGTP